MIYFKTLDNQIVRYNKKFNVKPLYDFESPKLFAKYYGQKDGHVYIAIFVCIGEIPIWTVGSYGELWEDVKPPNYEQLPLCKQLEILDLFNGYNEDEMQLIEAYTRNVVIPILHAYCKTLDDNRNHIIDVRKVFEKNCSNLGFINMN